ncbi:MoaD/ThiS family protein [Caloramator quimbayensis]|uniref:MoaD/ThiS family protein n=1 Tax=Caloramator quimbayensis TaxID=1147123 RepID=UPI003119CA80
MIASGLGYKEKEFELKEGTTIKELLEIMKFPIKTEWIVVSVNGRVKDKSSILIDNDEVLILPVGGGG